MMKPFEPFQAQRATAGGRLGAPVVRIRDDGRLVLNSAAIRAIETATHVQLLWDADTNRFGLKPTSMGDPAAFRVSYGASQATITSKEFVETHQLPADARFILTLNGGIWIASPTT